MFDRVHHLVEYVVDDAVHEGIDWFATVAEPCRSVAVFYALSWMEAGTTLYTPSQHVLLITPDKCWLGGHAAS